METEAPRITMEDEDWQDIMDKNEDIFDIYKAMYGQNFPEKDIAEKIHVYASPVLMVVGTIGNILSAIVLFKMCRKVLTTCLYLFVISIIDLVVLYIRCGNEWVIYLANYNIMEVAQLSSNSVCKMYPFMTNFALHLSIWLVVAMATETTIVTLRPERLIRVCVIERAKAVILLIIVLLVCVNAHCFWTFNLMKEKAELPDSETCTNLRQGQVNDEFRRVIWPIIDILVTDFFPYFTVFSCTVIMVTRRVRHRGPSHRDTLNIWKSYQLDAPAAKDFQFTILVLCFVYLLLMITKFALDIFLFLVEPGSLELVAYTLSFDAKILLAKSISAILHFSFLCCKFFVFIITSKRFREELRMLFTCRSCRRRHRSPPNRYSMNRGSLANSKSPMFENHVPYEQHLPLNPPSIGSPVCNTVEREKKAYAITSV